MVAYADTIPGLLKQIADQGAGGVAADGTALPANFESLAQTITPGPSGPTAIVVTNGTNTWTQTLTYDGSGNLTNVSAWVRT